MEIRDYLTLGIPKFTQITDVRHTKLYDLIRKREIDSVLVGRRRLIIVASYLAYLDRQREAQAAGNGRIVSPNPRARVREAKLTPLSKPVAKRGRGARSGVRS